jgi:hypothetical protein
MPNRTDRRRSNKTAQRLRLARLVSEHGVLSEMPCSLCFERGVPCKAMDGVSRCAECVRRGRSCDGLEVPFGASRSLFCSFFFAWVCLLTYAVERILAESRRLDSEEERAEDVLRRSQDDLRRLRAEVAEAEGRVQESLAQMSRARQQRRLLVSKGAKMINRGVANLDELGELEESEEVARRAAVETMSIPELMAHLSQPAESEPDWTALDLSTCLGELGDLVGTSEAAVGSSGGS